MSSRDSIKTKKKKKVFPRNKDKSTDCPDGNNQPRSPQLEKAESSLCGKDSSCSSENSVISKRQRFHSFEATPGVSIPHQHSHGQRHTQLSTTFPPQEHIRLDYHRRQSKEQFFGIADNPQKKLTRVNASEGKDLPRSDSTLTKLTMSRKTKEAERMKSTSCSEFQTIEISPQDECMDLTISRKFLPVTQSSNQTLQAKKAFQSPSEKSCGSSANAKLFGKTPLKTEGADRDAAQVPLIRKSEYINSPSRKINANFVPPRKVFNRPTTSRHMHTFATNTTFALRYPFTNAFAGARPSFQQPPTSFSNNVLFSGSAPLNRNMEFNLLNLGQTAAPRSVFKGTASNSEVVRRIATPHGVVVPRPIAHQNAGERFVHPFHDFFVQQLELSKHPHGIPPLLPGGAHQERSVFLKENAASSFMPAKNVDSNNPLHTKAENTDRHLKRNKPGKVLKTSQAASALSSAVQHVNEVSIGLAPVSSSALRKDGSATHSRNFQLPKPVERKAKTTGSIAHQSEEMQSRGQLRVDQTGLAPWQVSTFHNRPFAPNYENHPFREQILMGGIPALIAPPYNNPAEGVRQSRNVFSVSPNQLEFRPRSSTLFMTNIPRNNVQAVDMNPANVDKDGLPQQTYESESHERVVRWLQQTDEHAQNDEIDDDLE